MPGPIQPHRERPAPRRLAGAALAVALLAAPGAAQEPSLEVESAEGRVRVEAAGVPLEEVLRELARQNDFELRLDEPLGEAVDLQIDGLPLRRAVERILDASDLTYGWAGSSEGEGPRGGTLWVFSGGAVEPAPAAAPEPAVVEEDPRLASLIEALADGDVDRRLDAISDLVGIGGPAAEALADTALFDEDAGVREEAISGLGEIGGEELLATLERALQDPDVYVREAVIWAVSDIGGDEAVRVLGLALGDQEVSMREEAINALGEIGGESAMALLEQALEDSDESIRELASELLEELREDEG